MKTTIFISSVQKELATERRTLKDYIRGDPLLRRFFDVFLFEDIPAGDRKPADIYLAEVERCDLAARQEIAEQRLDLAGSEQAFFRA